MLQTGWRGSFRLERSSQVLRFFRGVNTDPGGGNAGFKKNPHILTIFFKCPFSSRGKKARVTKCTAVTLVVRTLFKSSADLESVS